MKESQLSSVIACCRLIPLLSLKMSLQEPNPSVLLKKWSFEANCRNSAVFRFHSLCHLFGTASRACVLTIIEKQSWKFTSSTKAILALPNLFVYITVMSVQKQAAKLLRFPTVSSSKPDVFTYSGTADRKMAPLFSTTGWSVK